MEKLPISVCIVASNEETNLDRCLNSVKDRVSEIIVLINDCTDNTDSVAREAGAQVFEEAWENYTVQVSKAISKASSDWILVLDADEELSDELANSIVTFVNTNDSTFNGAYFSRSTKILGKFIKHGDWSPDYVYRLFRKGKGTSEGAEHGRIDIDGQTKRLDGKLRHYSFPTLELEMSKIAHFANSFGSRTEKKWCIFECVSRSIWRFIRSYFIKLGILDGFPGLYVASYVSYTTFIKYSRLYKNKYDK
ncbi:MAG: glycosyltransferase family 2 protein [Lentisphaeria bacterium]|nr:glycosyltransferase family 2 protein [Lentisphaeria bacterium]NQZ69355.1 glycosyltransferase family 2 protein [Lentisphaeria bacterium]